jgi:outer membrane protein assembly factor BamE
MRFILIATALLSLGACSFTGFPGVYRINVEQGNIITEDMVEQLEPGMSRRQVRFVLGTPLVEDTFNRDRWDYVYVLRNGNEVYSEASLTVYFDGDSLQRYETSLQPGPDSAEPTATEDSA